MIKRRSRKTGTMYTVDRNHEGNGWLTICEEHASVLTSATKALALAAIPHPDWCPDCQDRMDALEILAEVGQ